VGYGSFARHVKEVFSIRSGPHNKIYAFNDDSFEDEKNVTRCSFTSYLRKTYQKCDFFVTLGYHHLKLKKRIIGQLLTQRRSVPTLVHPSAYVHPSAFLAQGSMVFPMCNIDKNVRIGFGSVIHNSVVISHDCVLGPGCYLAPGVVLSGNVQLGPGTFIGTGAVVSNGIRIGEDSRIGIGSVVARSLGSRVSAIGNPIVKLKRQLPLI